MQIRHILIKDHIIAILAGMVLGWSLFTIVSNSATLHSKWLLLPKIEISLVVNVAAVKILAHFDLY
jgi:hypothetical protein